MVGEISQLSRREVTAIFTTAIFHIHCRHPALSLDSFSSAEAAVIVPVTAVTFEVTRATVNVERVTSNVAAVTSEVTAVTSKMHAVTSKVTAVTYTGDSGHHKRAMSHL